MPPRTKRKVVEEPTPEPTEEDGFDYGKYLEKEPTPTQELACEWMSERTGYDLDPKTVQITLSLYGRFQKSEENREHLAERKRRSQEAAEAREERASERQAAKKAAAPTQRRSSRRAAAEESEEQESAPAPARRATRGNVAAPARKSAARGRRRPAPAQDDEDFD